MPICLACPHLPTHPSFPSGGCANRAPGLSLFPRGGGGGVASWSRIYQSQDVIPPNGSVSIPIQPFPGPCRFGECSPLLMCNTTSVTQGFGVCGGGGGGTGGPGHHVHSPVVRCISRRWWTPDLEMVRTTASARYALLGGDTQTTHTSEAWDTRVIHEIHEERENRSWPSPTRNMSPSLEL